MIRKNLPNPRFISNEIHHNSRPRPNRPRMSEMDIFSGQYIDHCLADHENEKKSQLPSKNDRFCKGGGEIKFLRSDKVRTPKDYSAVNELSSFIDAVATHGLLNLSQISFAVSRMENRSQAEGLLPADEKLIFYSADVRVNENPALSSTHNLFLREHNRLCEEILKLFPYWNDEKVYQMARKSSVVFISRLDTMNSSRPSSVEIFRTADCVAAHGISTRRYPMNSLRADTEWDIR